MEIIAHRGASAVAPENTVAAYRTAWEMGADAAETDVYLTKDNRIVAIHDETTKRTAGADCEVPHRGPYSPPGSVDVIAPSPPSFCPKGRRRSGTCG